MPHKLHLLRARATEPKKFRELVRELGVLLAYEATADPPLAPVVVETPLAQVEAGQLGERVGLVPILRAGLGMVEGCWSCCRWPRSGTWGSTATSRRCGRSSTTTSCRSSATVDVCLVLDPMLATGGSAVAAVDVLKAGGAADQVRRPHRGPGGHRAARARSPGRADPLAAIDRS